ncbi:phosphatidylinositol 5-phosphate 4-kinase type-2 gamma [Paramisgurnus dabryanus]|uniref:phosphatidylinositol 5-phosphate 4-kinase type-2 gamma n=1 Tax=Paramisgurnus dabryanus TaxID=90735 RepID=UPI0031F3659A
MSSPYKTGAVSSPEKRLSRTKSKKKHFVHQKVEVFRASDPILTVFMWGINHTINDLFQVSMPLMLLPDDFKASTKMKVNNHLFNKETLPGHFKFKEYCPLVFRNLRERFGVEDQEYQVSLTRRPPGKDVDDQDTGLLLTFDHKLIVKKISNEEVEDIHNILSKYHQHIVTCRGNTLLPQFLGMYRVTVENEDTYLIVTRNMFSHRLTVHRKYDFKVKDMLTSTDVHFINNMQRVYISEDEKIMFLDKLNRDIEFLVHLGIMDYSLLLGIHDVGRSEHEEDEGMKDSSSEGENSENDQSPPSVGSFGTSPEGTGGYMSIFKPRGPGEFDPSVDVYAIQSAAGAPQREIYFMGLIDILTLYDTKKKAPHTAKTVKHGAGAEISTIHPEQNAKLFQDFIANIFAY